MSIRHALEELVEEIQRKQLPPSAITPTGNKADDSSFFGPFSNCQGRPFATDMSVSWPKLAALTIQAQQALKTEALKPEIGGYDPDLDIG